MDEPLPVTDGGTNPQLAPAGKPVQESATAPVNPPVAVIVTVDVAEPPGLTVVGDSALAEMRKSGVPARLNVAVTDCAAVTSTMQVVPVLLQAPDQPENVEPARGAAVRVTVVASAKFAEQVVGQLIPAGELVTVPAPVPLVLTVRLADPGESLATNASLTPAP